VPPSGAGVSERADKARRRSGRAEADESDGIVSGAAVVIGSATAAGWITVAGCEGRGDTGSRP
jgi:hypothetical protein